MDFLLVCISVMWKIKLGKVSIWNLSIISRVVFIFAGLKHLSLVISLHDSNVNLKQKKLFYVQNRKHNASILCSILCCKSVLHINIIYTYMYCMCNWIWLYKLQSQTWQCIPLIPGLWWLRQVSLWVQVSLVYIVSSRQPKST